MNRIVVVVVIILVVVTIVVIIVVIVIVHLGSAANCPFPYSVKTAITPPTATNNSHTFIKVVN